MSRHITNNSNKFSHIKNIFKRKDDTTINSQQPSLNNDTPSTLFTSKYQPDEEKTEKPKPNIQQAIPNNDIDEKKIDITEYVTLKDIESDKSEGKIDKGLIMMNLIKNALELKDIQQIHENITTQICAVYVGLHLKKTENALAIMNKLYEHQSFAERKKTIKNLFDLLHLTGKVDQLLLQFSTTSKQSSHTSKYILLLYKIYNLYITKTDRNPYERISLKPINPVPSIHDMINSLKEQITKVDGKDIKELAKELNFHYVPAPDDLDIKDANDSNITHNYKCIRFMPLIPVQNANTEYIFTTGFNDKINDLSYDIELKWDKLQLNQMKIYENTFTDINIKESTFHDIHVHHNTFGDILVKNKSNLYDIHVHDNSFAKIKIEEASTLHDVDFYDNSFAGIRLDQSSLYNLKLIKCSGSKAYHYIINITAEKANISYCYIEKHKHPIILSSSQTVIFNSIFKGIKLDQQEFSGILYNVHITLDSLSGDAFTDKDYKTIEDSLIETVNAISKINIDKQSIQQQLTQNDYMIKNLVYMMHRDSTTSINKDTQGTELQNDISNLVNRIKDNEKIHNTISELAKPVFSYEGRNMLNKKKSIINKWLVADIIEHHKKLKIRLLDQVISDVISISDTIKRKWAVEEEKSANNEDANKHTKDKKYINELVDLLINHINNNPSLYFNDSQTLCPNEYKKISTFYNNSNKLAENKFPLQNIDAKNADKYEDLEEE